MYLIFVYVSEEVRELDMVLYKQGVREKLDHFDWFRMGWEINITSTKLNYYIMLWFLGEYYFFIPFWRWS